MTYSITTEAIDRTAREGEISEAIEAAVASKKEDLGDGRPVVDAAKHAIHGLIAALDRDVTSYRITVNGVHRKGKNKPSFSVSVQALELAESDDG